MVKKTHQLVKEPEISVRYLADYMAGSERAKRSIIIDAKYRPVARMIQHKEARAAIASLLIEGKLDSQTLMDRSEYIRGKLADDEFDISVNDANADYLARVSHVLGDFELPNATLLVAQKFAPFIINGVRVRFSPHVTLEKTGKKNVNKKGALMLRYAKGKPLSADAAKFQSAAIYCLLNSTLLKVPGEEADKALCITADMFTAKTQCAMGDAVTDFKNMQAALLSIAERWPAVQPPEGAIL